MATEYHLYSTQGCHLCDVAKGLLQEHFPQLMARCEVIDIAFDDDLYQRYGERIPVLQSRASGKEIGWPFTPEDVEKLNQ